MGNSSNFIVFILVFLLTVNKYLPFANKLLKFCKVKNPCVNGPTKGPGKM